MGLDNGINARRHGYDFIDDALKAISTYQWGDSFEIAYWRKCWNVRDAIGGAIGGIYDNGETSLSRGDVLAIIKVLKKFNKKNWDTYGWGGSIWEWSEIKKNHRGCIRRLRRLARLMKRYPLIEVYFYDSY